MSIQDNITKNKYALITGASRGIGRATALTLANQGYNIIINFLSNSNAASELLAHLNASFPGDHSLLQADVSKYEEFKSALLSWENSHPGSIIEVLVNNSGIRKDNLMYTASLEDWSLVIDTNLNSFFNVTKPVSEGMIKRRSGRIISIVSLSGIKGMPGQTNYAASKAGVIAATKSLALELAKRGITVNAIAPGFIKTDMTQDIDEEQMKALIPMNRFGNPEEVAAVVKFLAGPEASYITGQVIGINGGLYT